MPGLEKHLARYPQLYSRVGFVHQYRALSAEELRFILAHKWSKLGLTFAPDDFTDAEALAAIGRFDTTGSDPAGWYWSSSRNGNFHAWAQRFSDGYQYYYGRGNASSLRCVRG